MNRRIVDGCNNCVFLSHTSGNPAICNGPHGREVWSDLIDRNDDTRKYIIPEWCPLPVIIERN